MLFRPDLMCVPTIFGGWCTRTAAALSSAGRATAQAGRGAPLITKTSIPAAKARCRLGG